MGSGWRRNACWSWPARRPSCSWSASENLPETEAWDGDFRTSLADRLVEEPPEEGRAAEEVIDRAAREILPFTTRLDHPRSFAFVPSSPTWPGVLADFMVSGYHINAATWLTASGPSQLELVVIDWFRQWVGYPEGAGGLFTSGGSAATLNAFVAAREAAGNPECGVVYLSNQSHSVLDRAAMIIGLPRDRVRRLPADGCTGLDLDALREAVREDRAAGFTRSWCARTPGRPVPEPSIPFPRSPISAPRKKSGCTWTPPTAASLR